MSGHNDEGVVLYSYVTSPFAAKVHAALLFKQVPFVVHYVNPARVRKELPIGHQIPVLSINGEHMNGSDAILYALDEKFSKTRALLPDDPAMVQRAKEFNDWATAHLIPHLFGSVCLKMKGGALRQIADGWKLGSAMGKTVNGNLPKIAQFLWPLLLRKQGFVQEFARQDEANGPDRTVSIAEYITTSLGSGPYLFEATQPSLADVVLYGLVYPPYCIGLKGMKKTMLPANEHISPWLMRMHDDISGTPQLVPDHVNLHPLSSTSAIQA